METLYEKNPYGGKGTMTIEKLLGPEQLHPLSVFKTGQLPLLYASVWWAGLGSNQPSQ